MASGSREGTVRLWDVSTGEYLKTLEGFTDEIWSFAFSPDGQTFAGDSDGSTVKLWDISTGKCLKTFKGHTSFVWTVIFSPLSPAGTCASSRSGTEKLRRMAHVFPLLSLLIGVQLSQLNYRSLPKSAAKAFFADTLSPPAGKPRS